VVGGLIFGLLPVVLRPIMAPEAQWVTYGLVLIVILFILPRGIVPSLAPRLGFGGKPARAKPVTMSERTAGERV
jgi:branched-chain amino acid transport system permease protein